MENYPGNAKSTRPDKVEKPEPDAKPKIEKVISGTATRRKKPLGKRFGEFFGGADAKSVWHGVLMEVLIPAAKDMIVNAVTEGVERKVFGEVRGTSRRGSSRPSGNSGYVSYNRFSGGGHSSIRREPREDPRPALSRQARRNHEFDEISLDSRAEANEVLDQLYSLISQYEQASVMDLYEMVGLPSDFTDAKWGWEGLEGSRVHRGRDGRYLLDLPKPEPLA